MPQNKKPNVIVQERDLQILKELWQCGIMTPRQIATLLFDSNRATAKKRIGKLHRAGLIRTHGQSANRERVLGITEAGAKILRSREIIPMGAATPKILARQNIEHDLGIVEVRLAFHQAEKANPEFRLMNFAAYPPALSLPHSPFSVRPDAYVEFSSTGDRPQRWFIEVDRSTETRARLISRFREYASLRVVVGPTNTHKSNENFSRELRMHRVLVVCATGRRSASLLTNLREKLGGIRFFLITTLDRLSEDLAALAERRAAKT